MKSEKVSSWQRKLQVEKAGGGKELVCLRPEGRQCDYVFIVCDEVEHRNIWQVLSTVPDEIVKLSCLDMQFKNQGKGI